ncbi:MAG: aminoglycoside phosphotransferase family protein [Kiritimatiellae bacterium]|nr:aminoglycoside phosphotransferase family protein [Kiritimatiellia bacterium]
MSIDLKATAAQFQIFGDIGDISNYGSGHINDTYMVQLNLAGRPVRYIMQRINSAIFTNPPQLMDNICRVTDHLRKKLNASGSDEPSRRTLSVIPSRDGKSYYRDAAGNWWRMYLFIEGARTFDVIERPEQAYEAARAFARFQNQLADLPAPRLAETIPYFHNIRTRLAALDAAAESDCCGRLKDVADELAFVNSRRGVMSRLLERHERGEIPERITHNDTKINNVMIDDRDGTGVCVIDLDTVMPGLALYDFGDMIRTATASAAEDETDLSKVGSRFDMFEALVRGYRSEARFLLPAEIEELAFSGQVITFTIGVRFLTDYLAGDVYFKTHRPGHNLDRCRTQFAMVKDMEAQAERRNALVKSMEV